MAPWRRVWRTCESRSRRTAVAGDVFLPDGRMLNEELVREGLAWWYTEYAPGNVTLEKLEAQAREAKRNLWSHKKPVPPWVYRHR